jgi:hypothetical protein
VIVVDEFGRGDLLTIEQIAGLQLTECTPVRRWVRGTNLENAAIAKGGAHDMMMDGEPPPGSNNSNGSNRITVHAVDQVPDTDAFNGPTVLQLAYLVQRRQPYTCK